MKLKAIILGVIMCLSFVGCGKNKETSVNNKYFYGVDNNEVLHNPGMGWSYSAFPEELMRFGIPDGYDVATIRLSWDKLEPQEGVFDFEYADRAVEQLKNANKMIYFRLYLMPDNVWGIDGYPAWIRDNYPQIKFKQRVLPELNNYSFYHPDYENAVYQGLIKKFLSEIKEHYPDGVADVIDVRCYGLYGEWDSGWGNYWDDEENYEDRKRLVLNRYVDIYSEVFGDFEQTEIAINIGAKRFGSNEEAEEYYDVGGYRNALDSGFAIRYDGVAGTSPDNLFLKKFIADYYPHSPIFSETWNGFNPEQINIYVQWECFKEARVNTATYGFNKNNYMKMPRDLFEKGLKEMGYRILPSEIKYSETASRGGTFVFDSLWTNTGCGIMYKHYPLCVTLIDAAGEEVYMALREDFDLTELVSEKYGSLKNGVCEYRYKTEFKIPTDLKKGKYNLNISLVDKYNNYHDAVAMPLGENANETRRYKIGTLQII